MQGSKLKLKHEKKKGGAGRTEAQRRLSCERPVRQRQARAEREQRLPIVTVSPAQAGKKTVLLFLRCHFDNQK